MHANASRCACPHVCACPQRLRSCPPGTGWPADAYALIGREDVAAMVDVAARTANVWRGCGGGGGGDPGAGECGRAAARASPAPSGSEAEAAFVRHGHGGGGGVDGGAAACAAALQSGGGGGSATHCATPMLGAAARAALTAAGLGNRYGRGYGQGQGPGQMVVQGHGQMHGQGDLRRGGPAASGPTRGLWPALVPNAQAAVGPTAETAVGPAYGASPNVLTGAGGDGGGARVRGGRDSGAAMPHTVGAPPMAAAPSESTPASIFCFGAALGLGGVGTPQFGSTPGLPHPRRTHPATCPHAAGIAAVSAAPPPTLMACSWLPHGVPAGRRGAPWVRWQLPFSYHLHTATLSRPAAGPDATLPNRDGLPAAPSDSGAGDGGVPDGPGGPRGLCGSSARLRFGHDGRLASAGALLSSHRPQPLSCGSLLRGREADPEAGQKLQQQLWAAAQRTLALPVGRGALALGTLELLPSDAPPLPPLCLSGTLPAEAGD
eukprot:9021-Chlamydomonas_euryale.AAC.3